MPKVIPEAVKERIIELLRAGKSGPQIVSLIAAEFAGYKISPTTVSLLRPRADLGPQVGGRRLGEEYSPNRDDAVRLRAAGLTLTAIGAELGISKQAVSKLLRDRKLP